MVRHIIFILFVVTSTAASAHPVPFQGAVGVMTWNQPFLSDYWVTYSFTRDAAIAARAMRMEMPSGEYVAYFPQLDFLAKRWNNADSQANIYLYGGGGGANFQSKNGFAGLVGAEADAESRKWYVSGKWESMWSNIADQFNDAQFRVGLAPYEAEFNEVASWLMLQVQYHPVLQRSYAITPLYRMFYRNILWEAGVSIYGEWMLNFMFHF